jgi:bifunctional DNA-binding transcriptional regulator/antitoxin component of YhaV-PrlF toxin-antitoxin module
MEISKEHGYKTKLTESGQDGLSLRTTLPAGIRKQLGIEPGDTLHWILDKINDEWVIIVRKADDEPVSQG